MRAEPFLDIRSLVLSGGERGLLGLAFHPGFPKQPRIFVDYTRVPDGASVIAEFRATSDRVDPASQRVLLLIPQPFANHNGGQLAFGPDGYLYIGMGDGGSGGDPFGNGQNTHALLGKLLRIDVDGPPAPGKAYAIAHGRAGIELRQDGRRKGGCLVAFSSRGGLARHRLTLPQVEENKGRPDVPDGR